MGDASSIFSLLSSTLCEQIAIRGHRERKMAFPNSDGTACPDSVIWLDQWNEASADSSSVLFLDCPPFLLFSSGPRFSLSPARLCAHVLFGVPPTSGPMASLQLFGI